MTSHEESDIQEIKLHDAPLNELRRLPVYAASPALKERLKLIPEKHSRVVLFGKSAAQTVYARITAFGLVAAVILLFMLPLPNDRQYSPQDVVRAEQELRVAFSYLSDVSMKASSSVNRNAFNSSAEVLYRGVSYPFKGGDSENVNFYE